MKRAATETKLVYQCLEWLAKHRIFAYRNNTGAYKTSSGAFVRYGHPGSSDILGIMSDGSGRALCVECKTATGKQRKAQLLFQRIVERNGGVYLLVRTVEELQAGVAAASQAALERTAG